MGNRKRKILAKVLLVCMVLLTGCQGGQPADREPVNISIWHVYGGQADSPMNDMIDLFNATVGRKQNIQVETTMISNTNNIHDDVLAAVNGDPGAAEL
ncbi:MAG: hypothetical protein Q4C06_05725, partial [Bacillota bacterium]|nr:hypothetical protein [Bacillota bacterium]